MVSSDLSILGQYLLLLEKFCKHRVGEFEAAIAQEDSSSGTDQESALEQDRGSTAENSLEIGTETSGEFCESKPFAETQIKENEFAGSDHGTDGFFTCLGESGLGSSRDIACGDPLVPPSPAIRANEMGAAMSTGTDAQVAFGMPIGQVVARFMALGRIVGNLVHRKA